MARVQYKNWAVDSSGDVVGSSAYEVRDLQTGVLSTLYSSRTGGAVLANPGTAEAGGDFTFFAEEGSYTITIGALPGETIPWEAISADSLLDFIEERTFTSRAAFVAWVAAGNVPEDGKEYRADGLSYLGETGATAIPDLLGLVPAGDVSPEHYGAVGDGVADDSAAFVAAFAEPVAMHGFPRAKYRIVDTTIPVTHPTTFDLNGSSVIFEGMGGFAGKDGFNVSVPLSAEKHSVTKFHNGEILVNGTDGRYGIKTPVNEGGAGNTLFNTVSPKFVFDRLTLGGSVPLSTGANLLTENTWFEQVYSGESDNSEFTNLKLLGSFLATDAAATWGDKINTSGIHLQGRTGDDGSGPVRNPKFEHILCHGMGAPFRTTGYVSTPRWTGIDTFANFYGGIVSVGAISTGGGPSLLSEASITNVQFNGIAGGCKIQAADYITFVDPDITDTSFGAATVEYSADWIGIEIEDEIRQLTLYSPRFYAARTTAENDHVAVKAVMTQSSGNPSFLNVTDPFIRNVAASPAASRFTKVFDITDANFVNITNPFFAGNITDFLALSGTLFLSPRVNLVAQKSGAVTGDLVTLAGGMSWINVRNIAAPIVGTVLPTSTGLPDAVIEVGGASNADRWIKYEGGWMEQTRVFNAVPGPSTTGTSVFYSAEQSFTFSEPFIEPPNVHASVRTSAPMWGNARATSNTAGAFTILSDISSAADRIVDVKITGRWK